MLNAPKVQPDNSRRSLTSGLVIAGCLILIPAALTLSTGPARLSAFSPLLLIPAALPLALPLILVADRRQASRTFFSAWKRDTKELRLAGHSIDNSPTAMFWLNSDGRVIYGNDAASKVLGYPPSRFLTLSVFDFEPDWPAAAWPRRFQSLKNAGSSVTGSRYRRLDGTFVPVEATATFLEFEQEEFLFISAIDITERESAETKKATLDARLRHQHKMESLGTLAGGVAHEINNPVCGIMNYAFLIRDDLVGEPRVKEYSGEIIREAERVAAIVRNLLVFARQDGPEPAVVKIPEIVESTLSLFRTVLRHDQIGIQLDIPQELPQVRCRRQQIQQVLMSLLTNARDALNERHPRHDPQKKILVSARSMTRNGEGWIRTTVEDLGAGIPAEIRGRIFDPFFTTRRGGKATGLGLSISHGIVHDHGGELTFESEVDRFTRFHLDLRAEPTNCPTEGAADGARTRS